MGAEPLTTKPLLRPIYRKTDGTIVPAVHEVLAVLDKPWLVKWAWGLGRKGIDMDAYVGEMADAGLLAHRMAASLFWTGDLPARRTLIEWAPAIIEKAENSALKLMDWLQGHGVQPIAVELGVVSEQYGYGGTLDFHGLVDGFAEIIDIKTGAGIFDEHVVQLAAYRKALEEHGYKVERVRVLSLPRGDGDGFSEHVQKDTTNEWLRFWHALHIFRLRTAVSGK